MNLLTRDQILKAQATLQRERVNVPEWGGDVWVTVMSGTERDAWEMEIVKLRDDAKSLANMRARLVVRCVTDEEGNKIFAPDDADALGAGSWLPLDRITTVAQQLNKLRDQDLEELKGKSAPNPGDGQS